MKGDRMERCRRSISRVSMAVVVFSVTWLAATTGRSEIYVGPQIGGAIPFRFQSVEGTGQASGTDTTPIPLRSSFLYGGKVGYFLPSIMDWLGVEADERRWCGGGPVQRGHAARCGRLGTGRHCFFLTHRSTALR